MSWVWIPNLGALPIIASVSPQHIPCLFACFYECVVYVYAFFSTCFSSCVASAAWFMFGSVFINTFVFSFHFSCEFNTYLWCGTVVIRMTLLVCLSTFSTCMSLIVNPVYVCVNICAPSPGLHIRTHVPPFSHVLFVSCSILIPMFLFPFFSFRILIDICVTVSIAVIYPYPYPFLWFLLYLHFAICTSTIICSVCPLSPPNK